MKRAACLLALLAPLTGRAADWTWTKTDTAMEVTYLAVDTMDWGQTRDIAWRNRNLPYAQHQTERNPVLGYMPTNQAKIDAWFLGGMVVHAAISRLLPHGWMRTTWQASGIAFEGLCVGNNFHLGLQVRF